MSFLKRSTALVFFVLFSITANLSFAAEGFPKGPDANLTPGALCQNPDSYRYPEQINYCNRDVSTGDKRAIFDAYDQIGYRTRSYSRQSFKIDHYIPLCMGGANDKRNLWPQHQSVYKITDPLEPLLCEKMAEGKLRQSEAVKIIMQAKAHLDQVPEIIAKVQGL